MTADHWCEVERLFHEACQLAPAARGAFVANIADADVRSEVSSLLTANSEGSASNLGEIVREAAQAVAGEPSPGSVLGHFRVLHELGHGGMGVVYLAEDTKLHRQVALKLLPPGLHNDRERLRRFQREARLAAALNHLNIVTVFEIGEWEGRPFIATELVQGETLAERVVRGPLSPAHAASVGSQILAALAIAHKAGIIHRDLKPANVMVRSDGTVKVLDFGLARLVASETPSFKGETMLTAAGGIVGTPAYVAPEQWEGEPADARSDIYSFGCVLYEMLTARRVAPQRQPIASSAALDKIVSRCLEQDPVRRWQSAEALSLELGKVVRARGYWREIGIAAAGMILLSVGILWWARRTQARTLTDKDVVVLADFANTTGDPIFDGALRQALAIQLEQSPFLKVMDDAQMRQDLRLMRRSPGEPITNSLAHDICVRDAAAATIEGSIASMGKAYAITLQAVTCQNGATVARQQSQAEDKEHVLQAVGTAATAMRARLGESLASIEKLNRPLDQYTSSSLEALQAYAMGYTPQSQGQFLRAIPFFQRAVELDSNFAWAYEMLALAYSNAGDIPRSNEFQTKAFALCDRVSEFERQFILGRYLWMVAGDLDRAIDVYGVTARSYPRYWGEHSELSVLYRSMGEFEKALAESQEAVRLEQRVEPAYRNLASAYIVLDRLGEAKDVLAQARARQFDGSRLHQRFLEIAQIEGDQPGAEREIQWYAGKPEEYISFGLQAANADVLGRRGEASQLYRRAAETALRRGFHNTAAEFEEADSQADALLGNCQNVRRAGRAALAAAMCGDAARAERLAAETSKTHRNGTLWNAVQLPAIRAAIELRRDHPAKAIELLSSAGAYERAWPEARYLRGLAMLRLRKGADAAAEFQKILDHKGANRGLFYSLSWPGLARASALAGDTRNAKQAYQEFFSLWKDADSNSGILRQARGEFASLAGDQ